MTQNNRITLENNAIDIVRINLCNYKRLNPSMTWKDYCNEFNTRLEEEVKQELKLGRVFSYI